MIPDLVRDLIDWYIWKDKIGSINREYYRDYKEWVSYTGNVHVVHHSYKFSYNHRILSFLYSYIFSRNSNYHVATIPLKYYYSSGLHNPYGYNNN